MQQPSTSKNLPDILHRNQAEGNEICRINRSPTTNRKIPDYTVPLAHHKQPALLTQDNIEDWSDESLEMENSTSSNHSGGSNATVKMDDLIMYADIGD